MSKVISQNSCILFRGNGEQHLILEERVLLVNTADNETAFRTEMGKFVTFFDEDEINVLNAVDTVDKTINYFKDVFFYYTLFALLIKSYFVVGFIIDGHHSATNITFAYNIAKPHWYFYVGAIVFFLAFGFLFKGRWRMWYFWGINLFFSFLFLIDLWYMRGFSMVPLYLFPYVFICFI